MTTVGDSTQDDYAFSGRNYANQVSGTLWMPANGWLTNAHVVFGGNGSNPWSALVLWRQDNGGILWNSSGFRPGSGLATQSASIGSLRMPSGAPFRLGFWRDPSQNAIWGLDTGGGTNWGGQTATGTTGPVAWAQNVDPWSSGSLTAWCDYVANATPNAGVWQSPTPSGSISDSNPTFSGTTPQNPADSAYEFVGVVHWQILDPRSALIADVQFSVNAAISSWTYKLSDFGVNLQSGVQYTSRFQYTDSWGVWSGWSSNTTFTINTGPNPPTTVAPAGKINQVTGISYQATYTQPSSLSAQTVQAQVFSTPNSRAPIFDSGALSRTVANGGTYTISQWHNALAWGTTYYWWTRAQDTNGVWGPWSAKTKFTTDNAPNVPNPVSPGTGSVIESGSIVLSATVTDPDGDNLTSATWDLYDVTAGAEVAGYPLTVTGTTASGGTVSKDVTSALTTGHQYQWRVAASDGVLTGAYSPFWTFTFTAPPGVTITSPSGTLSGSDVPVVINYTGGAAKATDRTQLYQLGGVLPELIYDTGVVPSSRTSWDLPFGTLTNGDSYEIVVTVTDINGLSATSSMVTFNTSWTVLNHPNWQLLIDGVDRTANMDQDGWYSSQDWGRQSDGGQITLTDEHVALAPNFHVRSMATVELRDLNIGKIIFGGVCTQPWFYRTSPNVTVWKLNFQGPALYGQDRVVSYDYSNMSMDAIIRDLTAKANCGITTSHVLPGPTITRVQGQNETLATAWTKICQLASTSATYAWWVDPSGDLHVGSDTLAEAAPSGVTITDNVTAAATQTRGYIDNGQQMYYLWDSTSLATRVFVQGGDETSSATQQFVGDGVTTTYPLTYPVQANPMNAEVVVNGVQESVGTDSQAMWQLIEGAPGVWSLQSTQPPSSGAVITITYDWVLPVVAIAQDGSAIAAASGPNGGLFDLAVVDSTLLDLQSAQLRAMRELQEFGTAQERVVFTISADWPGWINVGEVFQFVNAAIPDSQNGYAAGINAPFLVTQLRAQGIAGGFRNVTITAVRVLP